MPKFNPNQLRAAAPHKVTVKLIIRDDEGAKQEVTTDVIYRGLSLDDQPDFPSVEGLEGKARLDAIKAQLAFLVVSIPDFGVGPADKGYEQQPDAAYFGAMDDPHITAISDAIAEDRDPNAKPSSSSQPTTGAEGE